MSILELIERASWSAMLTLLALAFIIGWIGYELGARQ